MADQNIFIKSIKVIQVLLVTRLAGNRLDSPVKQPAYQLTVLRYY